MGPANETLTPARVALAGMAALAVGMGIGRFAFTPLLPMMQADIGVSNALAGWVAAANYVGYLAGALWAVRLRAAAGRLVRGSLVVTVAATCAMAMTDHPVVWLVLRAVAGAASAWILVFGSARVLALLAERRREGLSGVLFGGVGLGTALAGGACLVLLHLGRSSHVTWLALGLLAAALTVWCWPAFGGGRAPPRPAHPRSASGSRSHVRAVLAYGCFGFGYIIPATFLPAMARDVISDPALFGWAWPVFGLAALTSTLVVGGLRARVSNRRIWIAGQSIMAGAVATPVMWPGLGGIIACAVGVGGTLMVVTLAALEEARRLAPAGASTLMAQMTAAFATGQIAGPVLVSVAAGYGHGVGTLLPLASVLLLASIAPLLREARPPPLSTSA